MTVSVQVLKRNRFGAGEVQITVHFFWAEKGGGTGHVWLPKEVGCSHEKMQRKDIPDQENSITKASAPLGRNK